jgi:hypothetical protein
MGRCCKLLSAQGIGVSSASYLDLTLIQKSPTKAALSYLERLHLPGPGWCDKKQRAAKILVELKALRGVYGMMFGYSASAWIFNWGRVRN